MLKIEVNGEYIHFLPGETIDLGKDGLVVWFTEPLTEAYRIFITEYQKVYKEQYLGPEDYETTG